MLKLMLSTFSYNHTPRQILIYRSVLSQVSLVYYSVASNAGIGQSPYPLFFCVQFIVVPTNWVFIDIFYVFLLVFAITADMIVEPSLLNVFAILLVAKTLECRYKLRTRAIRSLNIRRDRRPRLSVSNRIFIFFHPKQKMDMVRHYYTFLNRQMIIENIYLFDIFICYLPVLCQFGGDGQSGTPVPTMRERIHRLFCVQIVIKYTPLLL